MTIKSTRGFKKRRFFIKPRNRIFLYIGGRYIDDDDLIKWLGHHSQVNVEINK